MSDDRQLGSLGVVVGLVVGSALGAVVGTLADAGFATLVGYGTGGGLVVGALAGKLLEANRDQSRLATRTVGGGATLGLVVGVGVGGLAAWTFAGSVLLGALVGAGAGLLHGSLVGVILLSRFRRTAGDSPSGP